MILIGEKHIVEREQRPGEHMLENLTTWVRKTTWLMRVGVLLLSLGLIVSIYAAVNDNKTLWEWLELVMVPVAVAFVVFLLNQAQSERELVAADNQQKHNWQLAKQRSQDEALLQYLSQMANLLIDQKLANLLIDQELRASRGNGQYSPEGDGVDNAERYKVECRLARARTLWVLWQIDPNGKRNVLKFLHETGLIKPDPRLKDKWGKAKGVVGLSGADFRGGNLRNMELQGDALAGADLKGADLMKTNLSKANLGGADLKGANLAEAKLAGADLTNATLGRHEDHTKTNLRDADLTNATLVGANFRDADLTNAALVGANFRDADLTNATLENADLTSAKLGELGETLLKKAKLTGATMPDGRKYDGRLNDQESPAQAVENSGGAQTQLT